MKKICMCLFALLCLFVLAGCDQPEPPVGPSPDEPTIEEYEAEIKEFLNNAIPSEINETIEFPEYYEYEDGSLALMEWSTSNVKTLSKKGVFRANLFDEEIIISATISFNDPNGEETFFSFEKKAITRGTEDLEGYKKIIEGYLPDYVYQDFELVVKDSTYRGKNAYGKISYKSGSEDILTSDGKYVNQNLEDQEVEFFYTVEINGIIVNGSKIITVEGKKFDYFTQEAINFLDEYYKDIEVVYDQLELVETDDLGRVTIEWVSSDLTVLSHTGVLLTYEPNNEVKMTANIKCYDGTLAWEKTFRTYTDEELIDFIVSRMHRDEIQQFSMKILSTRKNNLGFIPFYINDVAMSDIVLSGNENNELTYLTGGYNTNANKMNVVTALVPWNATGRIKTKKTENALITVHDTGDLSMSAAQWSAYESSGNDTRQVSWHFTVGEDAIYQQLPIDETAKHAGDGTRAFSLKDTGVKYDGPDPLITLGDDHYIYIGGQKSNIEVPKISESTNVEWNGRYANAISQSGLYTCLGENGNYWMADVYASNYWQNSSRFEVCTKGGNNNSIGIETSVYPGEDYNKVMRNVTNLVATLLMYYDLNLDRVLYHRNFSGKLCPQIMIENNMLPNFENMLANEWIIKKYLPTASFVYESNNPNIMDDSGMILKAVTEETTVSYKVTVTYNGVTKSFEKETVIKPIK